VNKTDVIIIGAGPAALSAGLYIARGNMGVTLIEKGAPGGKIVFTSKIENYIGVGNINGADLALQMYEHAINAGVKHEYGEVTKIESLGSNRHIVTYGDKQIEGRFLIIAVGAKEIVPEFIKNINDFNDKGVSYCVICDGPLHKGSSTAIIGGGNSAIEEASYLSTIAKKVYVFVRKPNEAGLRAEPKLVKALKEKNNVEIVYSANVKSLHGKNHLEKAIVDVDGKEREYEITGLFPYIGLKPATDFIDNSLGIKNKGGYIKTNKLMETTIPNVYAIGDVREKEIRQITTAVADGTIAAKDIINKN